jgi:hypothetical protein
MVRESERTASIRTGDKPGDAGATRRPDQRFAESPAQGTTQATLTDGARGTGAARRTTWRIGTHSKERVRSAGRTASRPLKACGSTSSAVSTSQRACHSGAETLAAEVEATTDPPSTTSQPSCSQFDGVSGQQVDASSSCPASHTPAASNTQCCVAASQTASQRSTEMRRIRFNLHSKGPRPALVKFQIALPPAGSQQTPKNQRNGNLILEPRQTPSSTPGTEDRRTGFTGPRQR